MSSPQIKRLLEEVSNVKDKEVIVYSMEGCPACIELKTKMNKIGIKYENVDMNSEERWALLEGKGGSEFVPQVEVVGYLIKEHEYDNINELISHTLSKMLDRRIVIK